MQESQHAGMIDERRIGSCAEFAHDIMSVREPESCWQISGERRMAITIAAIAAESSEATNRDIMSAEETNAAAKQTYSFLAPLRNEQPCEAGR